MDLKRITPDAIALCVSAFLLVAGALLAWQQARGG